MRALKKHRYNTAVVPPRRPDLRISVDQLAHQPEVHDRFYQQISRRVTTTFEDQLLLKQQLENGIPKNQGQPLDYKNLVVVKPWGFEFLVFDNGLCALWLLFIKNQQMTSVHCHPKKSTTLITLSGNAVCQTLFTRDFLAEKSSIILDKGVFHSTKSMSEEGLFLLELEVPVEKADLVRLKDQYGRSKEGYENTSKMEFSDLSRFGYFHLSEGHQPNTFLGRDFSVSLHEFSTTRELKQGLKISGPEKSVICRGVVTAKPGQLGIGQILDPALLDDPKLEVLEHVTLLAVRNRQPNREET